jgi:hypothetical protein
MQTNKTIPLLVLTLTLVTTTFVIGTNSILTVKAQSATQPALGSRADIFGHVISGAATTQTQASFGQFVGSTAQSGTTAGTGLNCNSINVNNGVGCGPSIK